MSSWAEHGIDIPFGATGGRVYKPCPQCSDRRSAANRTTPCLSIHIDKGVWKCHHCGWKGGLGKEYPTRKNFTVVSQDDYPEDLLRYFTSRGIKKETLTTFGVYTTTHFIPGIGKEWECVAIPYLDTDGSYLDIKYRARKDNKKYFSKEPDTESVPYNFSNIKADQPLIWVEGEIDVWSLYEAGYYNVISVPLGAPNPEDKTVDGKFKFWTEYYDLFDSCPKHIIAVDKDAPGMRLQEELVRRLGSDRCWITTWPDRCKDANDTLRLYGPAQVSECLENAKAIPVEDLYIIEDIFADIMNLFRHGTKPGEHPGWETLAKYYTVKKKQVTVVTGIPGHGKSNWVDALLVNLSIGSGWKFLFYSPEMEPLERHVGQLASKAINKPFLEGYKERMTEDELVSTVGWLNEHFAFLSFQDASPTIDKILDKARAYIARYGLDGLAIDPFNEIDHSRPNSLTETEYIGQVLSKCRRFAMKYNVHLWIIAHPRIMRAIQSLDGTYFYPVPTPYDINGSANWRNKPDICISIWRDLSVLNSPTQVHIQKMRWQECGKLGMIELNYDISTGRYKDREGEPPILILEEDL